MCSKYIITGEIKSIQRTFLVVQWLRLYAPNAGGLGSIPGQGIKFHTQLKVCMPQLKEKEKRSQAQSEGPVVK